MTETPVGFGPGEGLIGIVTSPTRTAGPFERTACLMFNAGVVPRCGPHRINVKLARWLADDGLLSMRFDLSGQGDSRAAAAATMDYRDQAVHDIRAAMDHLALVHGIERFLLFGVCSGAVNAYWAALADPRVAGILMVDGIWYRSGWTRWVRHWKRFRAGSWSTVRDALQRRVARLLRRNGKPGAQQVGLFSDDESAANPAPQAFCSALDGLVARGVSVHLVYTGSVLEYYSYGRQFRDVFRGQAFLRSVGCDFRPDIDHTFGSLETQRKMADLVREWAAAVRR